MIWSPSTWPHISGDWATFKVTSQKQERASFLPHLYEDRVGKVRNSLAKWGEAAQLLKQLLTWLPLGLGPDYADNKSAQWSLGLHGKGSILFTAGYDDRIMEAVKQALKQLTAYSWPSRPLFRT